MTFETCPSALALPGFVFDIANAELRNATGARITLRPQAIALLQCLARRPGYVHTRDELMRAVWRDVVVTDDSLVQCVGALRRALDDNARRIVQTEPRRGYRLVAALEAQTALPTVERATQEQSSFHQDIRFATTPDSVRLAYASSGQCAPLVRSAHWMTHLDWDWRSATLGPPIQALSRRHRLIRYDGRGYGLSDWDAAPATLDQGVADLQAVVDAAGLERFALLGVSTGAPVAIRFAARQPKRVTALVLLGGYARGVLRRGASSTSSDNFNAMLRLIEDGWSRENPAFRQLITSLHWPGANAAQMESFNHLQRVSCTPPAAVALLRGSAEHDVTDDLAVLQCPTLVLHSPRDARVPFEEGRLLASAIRGARLETFDSPNHLPLHGEAAFEFVGQQIEAFLLHSAAVQLLPRRRATDAPLPGEAASSRLAGGVNRMAPTQALPIAVADPRIKH